MKEIQNHSEGFKHFHLYSSVFLRGVESDSTWKIEDENLAFLHISRLVCSFARLEHAPPRRGGHVLSALKNVSLLPLNELRKLCILE